jgi:secretion/DNA translocation related TadE-like protein
MTRPAKDRGSASIYVAGAGLFLMMAGVAVAMKANDLVVAAQARTAADLAALAGAAHAPLGETFACTRAGAIAGRNGSSVASCALNGLDLTVTVRIGKVQATARAGPQRAGPEPT